MGREDDLVGEKAARVGSDKSSTSQSRRTKRPFGQGWPRRRSGANRGKRTQDVPVIKSDNV